MIMYGFLMFFGKNLGLILYILFSFFVIGLNLIDLNYIWKNDPLKSGSISKEIIITVFFYF